MVRCEVWLILAMALVAGCGDRDGAGGRSAESRRVAFTVADPWYRFPPREFIDGDQAELPKDAFGQVTRREAEALDRLERQPWVEVSPAEAEGYLGRPLNPAGGRLVLLRAVVLNEGNGGFSVSVAGPAVCVHHGCLGKSPRPMTRRAIVARLPALPAEVYVDCSMAE